MCVAVCKVVSYVVALVGSPGAALVTPASFLIPQTKQSLSHDVQSFLLSPLLIPLNPVPQLLGCSGLKCLTPGISIHT